MSNNEKNNISARHHYLPITYLKGFCNENHNFYIFDKNNKKLKKRPFSPKTHFFEWDRNTLYNDGTANDSLEKLYKRPDDEITEILKRITESKSLFDAIGDLGSIQLQFFLSNLFWRIPTHDKLADLFYKTIATPEFHSSILLEIGIDEANFKKHLLIDENLKKFAKYFILPSMTFSFVEKEYDINKWNFLYAPQQTGWNNHLTCDNPIIYSKLSDLFQLKDNIIFPLTGNKTLICINKSDVTQKMDANKTIQIDLAVFANASRYVCGSDPSYLEKISKLYEEYYKIYKNDCDSFIISETFSMFKRLA